MIRRTLAALLLASGLFGAAAQGGEPGKSSGSARSSLHGIYDRYVGENTKGIPLASGADLRRIFAPELAASIFADRTAARKAGDVPTLDGDPFVDAQE